MHSTPSQHSTHGLEELLLDELELDELLLLDSSELLLELDSSEELELLLANAELRGALGPMVLVAPVEGEIA